MGKKIKITLSSRAPKGSKSSKSSKGIRAASMKRPQKGPKRPIPQQRRDSTSSLSSAPNLSDEDGYSAVEDVPDSDDDEDEHVFAAEAEHFRSLKRHNTAHSSPRPIREADNEDQDNEKGANEDSSGDDMTDDGDFMGEDFSPDDGSSVLASSSTEDATGLDAALGESFDQPPERHVRFTGVPDTDSESDETEDDHDDIFPDIFVPQSALEPSFRREAERDDDDADSYSSDTYWDFFGHHEMNPFGEQDDSHGVSNNQPNSAAFQASFEQGSNIGNDDSGPQPAAEVNPSDDEDASSDGYETDGETTEEDEPVLIPRRHATPEARGQGNASPTDKGKSPAGRLFISSRKKPICIVNPVTRKMMVIRPTKRAPLAPPSGQFPSVAFPPFDTTQSSPLKNENIWLSEPLNLNNMQPSDLAFFDMGYDLTTHDSEGSFVDEDMEEEEDAGEKNLDLDAFIDMDAFNDMCAPDDEPAKDSGDGDADGAETPSTPSHGLSGTGIHNHPLLSHLRGLDRVGAFRMDQANQKAILSGQATRDSLAFSNPLFHGTLRGFKQGNLKGAATPLTPERRHKKAPVKSPLETKQVKRKASEVVDNNRHKRHQSFSDVQMNI